MVLNGFRFNMDDLGMIDQGASFRIPEKNLVQVANIENAYLQGMLRVAGGYR